MARLEKFSPTIFKGSIFLNLDLPCSIFGIFLPSLVTILVWNIIEQLSILWFYNEQQLVLGSPKSKFQIWFDPEYTSSKNYINALALHARIPFTSISAVKHRRLSNTLYIRNTLIGLRFELKKYRGVQERFLGGNFSWSPCYAESSVGFSSCIIQLLFT